MTIRRSRLARLTVVLLAVVVVGAACAREGSDDSAGEQAGAVSARTPAADLRAPLTGLLGEHVYLAASATGAALRGDTPAFDAYANALNGPENSNTSDIVAGVASAYGHEVGNAFDGLWRSDGHIPAVVRYTQALAAGDKAGQDKAVADLLAYAKTFGETMNEVNDNLPAGAVEEAITMHITTLKAVIDAQKAGDGVAVATATREAVRHMSDTAALLAEATVKKFPEKF